MLPVTTLGKQGRSCCIFGTKANFSRVIFQLQISLLTRPTLPAEAPDCMTPIMDWNLPEPKRFVLQELH
jgi:hypothetical protein